MTILGRSELIDRICDGNLTVSPLLSREQIGAASVDLRMGNVVLMVRARGASHVDPRITKDVMLTGTPHDAEVDRQQKHERYEIPFRTRFLLHPGSLALVPTLEWFKLPDDLHGSVTARSTWAREGLSIATATFIEPSYQGVITLELSNLSQIPIAMVSHCSGFCREILPMILFEGQAETVLGFIGGLLAELLRWFDLRYTLYQGLPDWSKSKLYWGITCLVACAAALLVYVYVISGTKLNPILALNIGASAPLLLGKLIQQSPPINPGSVN